MMDKKTVPQKIKLLVTIVDRGKGGRIISLCKAEGITCNLIILGHGTANSDILGILGLGETEKDIVMSTVLEGKAAAILKKITNEMQLRKSGKGIAFTIPINSIDNRCSYEFLSGILGKGCEAHGE